MNNQGSDYNEYRFRRAISAVKAVVTFPLEGKEWLDLGCHNGAFARLLCTYGLHVTGIDVFDPKLKTEKSWEYLQFDLNARKFPLDSFSFEVVSGLEIIEHIIDTDQFLNEVFRVLRPGGLFIISTPNICMLRNRFRIFIGRYPYGLEYKNLIHHVRLYNLPCLISQLREHNFVVLSAEGEKFLPQHFPETSWSRKFSEILAKALPTLCPNLLVVVRCPQ